MVQQKNIKRNITQEDVAYELGVSRQSVSKWERGESYPDITFLPALANIFETSIDMLIGMDAIRGEEAMHNIHAKASAYQRSGDYKLASELPHMRESREVIQPLIQK